ncbi:hypothetical protein P22_2038 [Propionispora sp. 2/2-37]|uniref:hypothetical protein n=1 Tax=Propionispora sp. 2/2-37 TaxID=1677858 RepID=UPI0006BB87F0|nr:hypothetical protein [Propionispora sp. 2/2-37]CUH95950.1 hypothetical protein P22_2038 [Propionispora sp. 2/2-37]
MGFVRKLALLAVVLFLLTASPVQAEKYGLQGVDVEFLPEWTVIASSDSTKLLLSDSPEMVSEDGILYQDQVEGNARLFFYHVNATAHAKKFDVVIENKGPAAATVTVSRYGLAGPEYGWMKVGKAAQQSYFTSKQSYQIHVPAKGIKSLSPQIGKVAMLSNMLINGIFDISADRPVTVKVMMMPVLEDSDIFAAKAKRLPPDPAYLRGTFTGANRYVKPIKEYDPQEHGVVAITLADNREDRYVRGTDAVNGAEVINYGNYGVAYQIDFPSKSGGRFACYLVPRGGEYAGMIGIQNPGVYWSPLATPQDRVSFGNNKNEDFSFLGTFDSGEPLSFTFSPPGASNLPVKIVIVPQ